VQRDDDEKAAVTRFSVGRLEEPDEPTPFRPVRLHFGITSFGVTTTRTSPHSRATPRSGS
jgi:hypothetical protein